MWQTSQVCVISARDSRKRSGGVLWILEQGWEGGLPCEGISLLHEPVRCHLVGVRLDFRRVRL